jgi:uncharacterized damage-inducible protein DinB
VTLKTPSLITVYSGWDGYQQSLVSAISTLSQEHLRYRPTPDQRSVGEIAAHIAFGRIDWFHRMEAPGTAELVEQAVPWWRPWGEINPSIAQSTTDLVHWLQASWEMIEANLTQWTVADLGWSYRQSYGGKTYAVSRQWVIWRILSHDVHHGGQLSILLAAQGVDLPELGHRGGHIIEVPLADEDASAEASTK